MKALQLDVELTSSIPLYEQIAQELRRRIRAGDLPPGYQLPTIRELAVNLEINFNTVARAYRMLDREGLISTQQGRGTFVLEMAPGKTRDNPRKNEIERLTRFFISKAAHLGYDSREIKRCFEEIVKEELGG